MTLETELQWFPFQLQILSICLPPHWADGSEADMVFGSSPCNRDTCSEHGEEEKTKKQSTTCWCSGNESSGMPRQPSKFPVILRASPEFGASFTSSFPPLNLKAPPPPRSATPPSHAAPALSSDGPVLELPGPRTQTQPWEILAGISRGLLWVSSPKKGARKTKREETHRDTPIGNGSNEKETPSQQEAQFKFGLVEKVLEKTTQTTHQAP